MRRVLLLLGLYISLANYANAQPIGAPAYRMGEPILIQFTYDGGIRGWDGSISVGENNDGPLLSISNGAYLIVSKGTHKFKAGNWDTKKFGYYWQTQKALHGDLVPPVLSRINKAEYMVSFKSPFKTVIDITEFFEMDAIGTYYIYWGMWDIWSQEFSFDVVAHNQKLETTPSD
jgi:hypothetical protein